MNKILMAMSLMFLLVGCSTYQKALKSDDIDYKRAVADDFFEKGDYSSAAGLYDDIEKKQGWKFENRLMFVNYAKSLSELEHYEVLSGVLSKFNALYPSTPFREQMLLLEAKTLYERSEPYSKDQYLTQKGIEKLKQYIEEFPNSENTSVAQQYLDQLNTKLEKKVFEAAKLYNKIGEYTRDYNAAIVSLDNFIQDYPTSVFKEEALYYRFDSAYHLAINSVYKKMEERLNNAIKYYNALVLFNKDTKYKKQADDMLIRLENELKQFEKK